MFRPWRRLLPIFLLALLSLAPALATQPVPVGPGTSHLSLYQPQGPWAIHVLAVDVTDKNLKVESLLGGGAVLGGGGVSKMLQGSAYDWHQPIGGVNADYFATTGKKRVTIPLGFAVANGELLTLPDLSRSAFYLTKDGHIGIERFYFHVWVSSPDGLFRTINVMNRSPEAAQVALFTPRFGIESRAERTSTQVVLSDVSGPFVPNAELTAKVVSVGTGESAPIAANGAVLAANGVAGWALQGLKAGDEVTLHLGLEPNVGELAQVVGGGPRLVRGGAVSVENQQEGFAESFATRRHPRTGLGIKGNELVLVTVDGRQPGYSAGMTLPEFAQLFVQLGCTDALNLDGGGSTTMVVRGKIVNSPSDGSERRVANALALFSLAPPLPPGAPPRPVARLLLDPQEARLLSGETLKLNVTGLDEYCEPTPVDASALQWELQDGLGTIANGTLTAGSVTAPATATVTARLGDLSASSSISVMPGPSRLALLPAQLTLAPGAAQQFALRAFDAAGSPVEVAPDRVTWGCSPATATVDARGRFRAPQSTGRFTVTASVGPVSAAADVVVGTASQVVEDFEKETPLTFFITPPGIPGSAEIAEDPRLKGNSCLKLSYDFSTTTDTRAAYAVLNLPLPDTQAIAMRVLGDGQSEWLRAKLRDSAGRTFPVDLAQHVYWSNQWKEVTAPIPQEAVAPVILESIYVSEFHAEEKPVGAVYVDDVSVAAGGVPDPANPSSIP